MDPHSIVAFDRTELLTELTRAVKAEYQRGREDGAREEREACAKMAETPTGNYQVGIKPVPYWDGEKLAQAIRARGEKPRE